jgi:2-polyprenyl-6-methoxyphenol hydroxylase-like FAD-dependent oxidoreductase
LAEAADGHGISIGYPTAEQAVVLSPTRPACVPQDHLERVLLDHLRSYPQAQVRGGTEVIGIATTDDGCRVVLRSPGGDTEVLEARTVVAADGAHSTVRDLLGIDVEGSGPLARGLNVLFRAPLWDVLGPHRYGIYGTTGTVPGGTVIPAGADDRWQTAIEVDPRHETAADYREARLVSMIRAYAGVPDLDVRIERVGEVVLRTQLAATWRVGSAFLVGDAAHCVTPRGGTGMNTAIASARDLAWKLAWVHRGWASPALLDTYEAERRPAAERNIARSADPGGTRRPVLGEVHQDLGGRLAHAWLPDGSTSTLDLITDGLTLLTTTGAWCDAAAAATSPIPLVARRLDAPTSRAIGIPRSGALLIRPDGHPLALWSTDTDASDQLQAAALAAGAHHLARR